MSGGRASLIEWFSLVKNVFQLFLPMNKTNLLPLRCFLKQVTDLHKNISTLLTNGLLFFASLQRFGYAKSI